MNTGYRAVYRAKRIAAIETFLADPTKYCNEQILGSVGADARSGLGTSRAYQLGVAKSMLAELLRLVKS